MSVTSSGHFKTSQRLPKSPSSLFHRFPPEIVDLVYENVAGLVGHNSRQRITLDSDVYDALASFDRYLEETLHSFRPEEFSKRYKRRQNAFQDNMLASPSAQDRGGLATSNFIDDLEWIVSQQQYLPYLFKRYQTPCLPLMYDYYEHTAETVGIAYYDNILAQSPRYDISSHWGLFLLWSESGQLKNGYFARSVLVFDFFKGHGIMTQGKAYYHLRR